MRTVKKIRCQKGRGESNQFKEWTKAEMQFYLQYKRNKGNPAMPKTVGLVQQRVLNVMHRPSPICSPHKSDEEMEEQKPMEEQKLQPPQTTAMSKIVHFNYYL